ncbi:hypothetical protein BD779DRAFT_1166779 [Infundibulicybe gibba]|nr:hypothetical protein BD779DRAFT_1166779 [Infundibulicybe gibba]
MARSRLWPSLASSDDVEEWQLEQGYGSCQDELVKPSPAQIMYVSLISPTSCIYICNVKEAGSCLYNKILGFRTTSFIGLSTNSRLCLRLFDILDADRGGMERRFHIHFAFTDPDKTQK